MDGIKMKAIPLLAILIVCMLVTIVHAQAFQYVFGTAKYSVPQMPQPAKSVPFQDPQFNTTHVRVSDKSIDNYGEPFMSNIYATVNIETADGKYALLGTYDFYLYDLTTFQKVKKLNLIHDGSDPEIRPDPFDPNVIYYLADTILYKYDLRDDSSVIVHDFRKEYPSAESVQTETQGDPSADGRYWAFEIFHVDGAVVPLDIVVYDKQTDMIISRFSDNYPPRNVRWTSMSPSGERVLVKMWDVYFCENSGGCSNGNIRTKLISFDRDFQNPVAIRGANGHSDKAVALDGRDVMFYQHTDDNWISMAYVETGQVIDLLKIDFSQGATGFHFSGNNYTKPGWGLVSTYDFTQDWQNKQLYMIELEENPRIWRVAHTRAQPDPNLSKHYWAEAFATISRSGIKVWWSANWGNYQNRLETYQINLPETWWQELSGGTVPVELTSFQARVISEGVELTWGTASETNNLGFEIERSPNGDKHNKIDFVKGHGTTIGSKDYQYIDNLVDPGRYYYRLKQIDFDGSFEYSGAVEVTLAPPEAFRLYQNYPNPFNPATKIVYEVPVSFRIVIKVYDLTGAEVKTLVDEVKSPGSYEVRWDGTNDKSEKVASGVYFYSSRFLNNNNLSTLTKKMILLQ